MSPLSAAMRNVLKNAGRSSWPAFSTAVTLASSALHSSRADLNLSDATAALCLELLLATDSWEVMMALQVVELVNIIS